MIAAETGYAQAQSLSVQVSVTESIRVSIAMKVAGATEHIEVHATISELQTDSVALGRVVDSNMIQALPLAARNFTQIVDLSPGVSTGVNNAGELGPGGSGLAQIDAGSDGIFVHGSRSYDNSYEFDGVPVTDLQAIIKQGNALLRFLLVEAAQVTVRSQQQLILEVKNGQVVDSGVGEPSECSHTRTCPTNPA